jgi:spoIIIJ-associated protein
LPVIPFRGKLRGQKHSDISRDAEKSDDEEIQITLSGDSNDIGRLIGRHGQTLDALQYIVGIAINRNSQYKIRTLLDAEGYRERHKQTIEAKALEIAKQVKELGEEAVLEPQSARDRRLIHVILADDPDVVTYSEGEGEDRHVVISPSKQ